MALAEYKGTPEQWPMTLWKGDDYWFWFQVRDAADVPVPDFELWTVRAQLQYSAMDQATNAVELDWAADPDSTAAFYVFLTSANTRTDAKRAFWGVQVTDPQGRTTTLVYCPTNFEGEVPL